MDKLDTMRVFVEVAKHQSFVAAGGALGMSAPATTRAIASLEARLGVQLFNRTTRHVRLTESGGRFLQDAKRIIEDLAEAEAAVTGVYSKPNGKLTITAPILFGEKHVIPIITEYLDMNPDVSVKAMYYDRVARLLEEELDVAIRIGHLKDSTLYATQVGHVHRVVCGAPSYFAANKKPKYPKELRNHTIIFPTTFEPTDEWVFQKNGKKEKIKLSPRLRCNQNSAALKAAMLGHGITRLMSYQVGEELELGALESILTDYDDNPLPVNVVHLERRRANAKTRLFIDLAVERLKSNPFINV